MARTQYYLTGGINNKINLKADTYMEDNPNCNNTVLLLRMYRDLSKEVAFKTDELSTYMSSQHGIEVNRLLETLEKCGVDLSGDSKIQETGSNIYNMNIVLNCINRYYSLLSENDSNGKMIQSVLFHSYFSKHAQNNYYTRVRISDDLDLMEVLCERSYLRYKRYAIAQLDERLWSDDNIYKDALITYIKNNKELIDNLRWKVQ